MMDSQDINAILDGQQDEMWGMSGMGASPSYGEEFSASAMSGVAEIGLPAMGFGAAVTGWSAATRMGVDPAFGAPRAGWRMGSKVAKTFRAGAIAKTALSGAGLAVGMFTGILPGLALDAAVRGVGGNIIEGAQSYTATNRFMQQLGNETAGFGGQSILGVGGAAFQNAQEWTLEHGADAMSSMGESTGLGTQGIMQMGGEMATSGMLGEVRNPQEFLSKFREKLGQVREVSRTLDISLQEATAVMQQLQDAGISSEGQVGLSTRAGAISGLTGQSLDVVMGAGMEGVQMGAQLGIGADRSFQVGMQNLSSSSVMSGLGAIDPRTLARYGGATGLAQQMTQIDLQMGMTHGGQELISRLVNEEGSGFDFARMGTARGGERPGSRRDIDPYAMADLQEDFLDNQRGIVLGRISQLRGEYTDDKEFHRAQYSFLREMGIDDPQMQQAYLQNLRSAPTMDLLETGQQIESDEQMAAEIRSQARQAFSRVFSDMGDWINEAISQPIQEFGRTMARTFEEAGQAISEAYSGRPDSPTGMIAPDVAALQEYGRGVWMGNFDQGYSRMEIADFMEGGGAFGTFQEEDRRGFFSRSGLLATEDNRLAAWAVEQESEGRLDLSGMGIRTARTEAQRRRLEDRGFASLTEGQVDLGEDRGWMMATGRQHFALRMSRMGMTVDPETLQVARPSQSYMQLFEATMDAPRGEDILTLMERHDNPSRVLSTALHLPDDFLQTASGRATLQEMMQSERLPESVREERSYRTIQGGMAAMAAEHVTGLLTAGGESDIGEDRVRELLGSARGRRAIRMVSAASEARSMFGGSNFFAQSQGQEALTDEQMEILDNVGDAPPAWLPSRDERRRQYQGVQNLRTVGERGIPNAPGTMFEAWTEEWVRNDVPVVSQDNVRDREARRFLEDEGVRFPEDIDQHEIRAYGYRPIDLERQAAERAWGSGATERVWVAADPDTYGNQNERNMLTGTTSREMQAISIMQRGQELGYTPDEMAFMALAARMDPTDEEQVNLFREAGGRSEGRERRLRRELVTSGRTDELTNVLAMERDLRRVEREYDIDRSDPGTIDTLQINNPELAGRYSRTRRTVLETRERWEEEGLSRSLESVSEETAEATAAAFERLNIPEADAEQLQQFYQTLLTSEAGLSNREMSAFANLIEQAGGEVSSLPRVLEYVTATQVEAVRAEQFAETAEALRAEGAERLFQSDDFLSAQGYEEFLQIREEQRDRASTQGRDPSSVTNADVMDELMERARNEGRMDGVDSYFETGASGAAELYMRLQGTGDVSSEGMAALDALVDRERRERMQALEGRDLDPDQLGAEIDDIEEELAQYRKDLAADWSNVSFADVMYGSGASMAEGGINDVEREILSILPGSERVFGLQATMEGGGDAEQLQTVLASMIGGGAERQQQFAESMGAESIEDLAAQLQEEGVGGQTFQELVGRAIAEGTLSTQSMEQFEERSMQQKRDQATIRMDENLDSVIAGSGRRALVTVAHDDVDELAE